MRRAVAGGVLLLLALVAADQWARAQVQTLLEDTVADQLAAATADARLVGALVLPQLIGGRIDAVELTITDAVVGEPAVRLAAIDADLRGLAVPFPPPATLDRVDVDDGQVEVLLLPRELARLLAAARPGWDVTTGPDGVRATGRVAGVEVAVVADVGVVGDELRFSARDVEVGELGLGAASRVAAAFDTRIPLPDLPDGLVVDEAVPGRDGLTLRGRVVDVLSFG